MWLIDRIAEQRIAEAIERGEFDDLPGAGRPLELEDDSMVPEELRAAYRILKNAGYLPPQAQLLKAIAEAEDLLRKAEEQAARDRASRRLRLLEMRLGEQRGRMLAQEQAYREKLLAAMDRTRRRDR